MSAVELGIEYFPDPTQGRPVFLGSIFVGQPNTDPEILTNQKQVTLRQESGIEVQVAQPVLTSAGGVPVYNGSPVQILVDGDYSLKVLNKAGAQVYNIPSNANFTSDSFYSGPTITKTLTSGQTVVVFPSNIRGATLTINGDNADNGALLQDTDWSFAADSLTITLTNSYPAGTLLTAYGYVKVGAQTLTLSSGQTVAVFSSNVDESTIIISGQNADNGALIKGIDYTVGVDTLTVTLSSSYPSGTLLSTI